MDSEWNEGQPIYRQLKERVVALMGPSGTGREVALRFARRGAR